jgi:hypothetical protein
MWMWRAIEQTNWTSCRKRSGFVNCYGMTTECLSTLPADGMAILYLGELSRKLYELLHKLFSPWKNVSDECLHAYLPTLRMWSSWCLVNIMPYTVQIEYCMKNITEHSRIKAFMPLRMIWKLHPPNPYVHTSACRQQLVKSIWKSRFPEHKQ